MHRSLLIAITAALALLPLAARAGGFWVWEVGTAADVGNAGAAWGAGADDASTAWTNPAAMTLVDQTEIGVQLTPSIFRERFNRDDATTVSGGSGVNTSFAPLIGGGGVWAVTDKLRLGAALGALAGGALDYGNDWSGRFLVDRVSLTTLGLNPGIGYRVNDWLSVGASAIIAYTTFEERTSVRNLLPGQHDGWLQLKDQDFGFGGAFGVLLVPRADTRVALTYRTPLKFDLADRGIFHHIEAPLSGLIDATGISHAKVKVGLKIPDQVLIGVSHDLTDQLTIVANADWENWSEFGAIDLQLASSDAQSVSAGIHSQDTWHLGVGLRWRPRPQWLLTTGIAYDSSMFSDSQRSPAFPIDRQIRVGGGVQYEVSKDLSVGFSYEYMNGGSASLSSGGGGPLTGTLSGDYDQNEVHFITISLNWRP
jgi:long-chain fatty acid transport protein